MGTMPEIEAMKFRLKFRLELCKREYQDFFVNHPRP
jgi:hypothetical protein